MAEMIILNKNLRIASNKFLYKAQVCTKTLIFYSLYPKFIYSSTYNTFHGQEQLGLLM